jgi:isoleucyl-tRNA synthetase
MANYNPKEIEEKVLALWKKEKTFEKYLKLRKGKKKFYFADGPPYATGDIHMGNALNKVLKDLYIRFYKMQGYDVWQQPGFDTHGVPIENKVEKSWALKNS